MEDRQLPITVGAGRGRAGGHARPAAVHADRRDHARRPADHAAARPLRHPAPARALRRRTTSRAIVVRSRRACSSVEIDDGGRRARSPSAAAARRASPTGCSSACATTPRSAATGAIDADGRRRRARPARGRPRGPGPPRPRDPHGDLRAASAAARSGSRRSPSRCGEEPDTIEDVYEPYLLQRGFLQRTPRGRCATARAFRHLGLEPPRGAGRACSEPEAPFKRGRSTLRDSTWRTCSSAPTAATAPPRPSAPPASATQPKGCSKCGFGFLFELLDDYYPAPNAAFFVCDQQGRIIGCGRGSLELTGLSDEKVIGRPVREVLGLDFDGGEDHVGTVLEWGVRQLGKPVDGQRRGRPAREGRRRPVPGLRRRRRAAARPDAVEVGCSRHPPRMSDRRRYLFVLLLVLGLIAGSLAVVVADEDDEARARPQGRRPARLPGQADRAAAEGRRRGAASARSTSCASASTSSASPSRSSSARARTRSRSTCPASTNAERAAAAGRHDRPAVLLRLGGERPRRRTARPTRHRDQRRPAADHRPLQRGQAAPPSATTAVPTNAQRRRRRRASTRSTRSPSSRSTTASRSTSREDGARRR